MQSESTQETFCLPDDVRPSGFYHRVHSIGDKLSTHLRPFITSFLCIFLHTSSCSLRSTAPSAHLTTVHSAFGALSHKKFTKLTLPRPLNTLSHWHALILTLLVRLAQFCTLDFITNYCYCDLRMHINNHLPLTVHTDKIPNL